MDSSIAAPAGLQAHLTRWVEAGLISRSQAESINGWEAGRPDVAVTDACDMAGPPATRPQRSVVVEALAYLGGAIILAALTVVAAGYWHLLGPAVRLAIPGTATAALLLAGVLIPQRLGPTASRVRGLLWLLSAATLAVLLIILTDSATMVGKTAVLVVASTLTVYTLLLWLAHRMAAQQVAAFASAELLAAALAVQAPDGAQGILIGAALTVLAAVWGMLAWRGWLPGAGRWLDPPGRQAVADSWSHGAVQRRWGVGLAAAGASLGATVLAAQPDLPWLGVCAVALAVAAALALADLIVLAIAAVGALVTLPMVVDHYFASTLSVAVVLLATGGVLVGLAVLVARRRTASNSARVRVTPDAGATTGKREQVSE